MIKVKSDLFIKRKQTFICFWKKLVNPCMRESNKENKEPLDWNYSGLFKKKKEHMFIILYLPIVCLLLDWFSFWIYQGHPYTK